MEQKLKLFKRSEQYLWTDEHISKEMLIAHLDNRHEGASRKPETIKKTVDWIEKQLPTKAKVLDLGCGPGFYTTMLKERGYQVTGYDINPVSIDYAVKKAQESGAEINYRCLDYLQEDIGRGYDAIIMIYCDFGALIPQEQRLLLEKIKKALKPGGKFIFDVFGEGLGSQKEEDRQWSYEVEKGFWGTQPHFVLEETKHFPKEKVWGDRNIVIEDGQKPKEYITWDQYYFEDEIRILLKNSGFTMMELNDQLIPKNEEGKQVVLFIVSEMLHLE